MHEGQIDVAAETVRQLLREQRPELADREIVPVVSTGTVNALFRLGDDLVARLPLLEAWADGIEREWTWLPRLAERIRSLRLPEPVFIGEPSSGYPFRWSILRWIEGSPYDDALVDDERAAAEALATFVRELRSLPTHDAPTGGRRPLRELDGETREAILAADGTIDASSAMRVWEDALEAPTWDGERTWVHGDLLRPNLLVDRGRLVAVIDFGGAGVGDPATDLMPAWSVFGPIGRETFRSALEVDEATWARGRGIALHQAALVIPYYAETNLGFVELSARAIAHIVDDLDETR